MRSGTTVLALDDFMPDWERRIEQNFNAPFPVVNAAIFHVLSTWSYHHRSPIPREDTAGATHYQIGLASGTGLAIYVMQRTEALTTLNLHLFVPRQGEIVRAGDDVRQLIELVARCAHEVTRAMRYSDPGFTLRITELTPPMPSWNDDPEGVILWKDLYARDMGDEEFAGQIAGISYSQFRKVRSAQGLRRTKRGRPSKDGTK